MALHDERVPILSGSSAGHARDERHHRDAGERDRATVQPVPDREQREDRAVGRDGEQLPPAHALRAGSISERQKYNAPRQGRRRTSMRKMGANVMTVFTTVMPSEMYGPDSGMVFERMSLL